MHYTTKNHTHKKPQKPPIPASLSIHNKKHKITGITYPTWAIPCARQTDYYFMKRIKKLLTGLAVVHLAWARKSLRII